MGNIQFKASDIAGRIKKYQDTLIEIYTDKELQDEADSLTYDLSERESEEKLRIVFIGQYTAGKSTIISALSGNQSILIDSDIATCDTADYAFGGLTLTDTPGLYTENKEHDAKTTNMIMNSDILVYCITSDLFNQYTLEDFKSLAYDYQYGNKMFLVVNKMSKESGDYEELKRNYKSTIDSALAPHSTEEFSCSYIDVKDYKIGIDLGDQELIECSHFTEFIESLNTFVDKKGYLGRFDSAIKIMNHSIDKVVEENTEDELMKAQCIVQNSIVEKIENLKKKLRIEAKNIIKVELIPITSMADKYCESIDHATLNSEELNSDVNELIEECILKIDNNLTILHEQYRLELENELLEIMASESGELLIDTLKPYLDVKINIFSSRDKKMETEHFKVLNNSLIKMTNKTLQLFNKSNFKDNEMTTIVKNFGKGINYDFSFGEAKKIAKKINIHTHNLKCAMLILDNAMEFKEFVDKAKEDKINNENKQIIRKEISTIVNDLESSSIQTVEKIIDFYSNDIKEIRREVMELHNKAKSKNQLVEELEKFRQELNALELN